MKKYYELDENGFVLGFGSYSEGMVFLITCPSDTTVEDGNCYYWDETLKEWAISESKKEEFIRAEVYAQLDANREALLYNEHRYGYQPGYAESFASKKAELIAEQAALIGKLK